MTADIPIKLQPLFDFYSNAVNSTTLENYKIIGDLPNRKRIVITVDDTPSIEPVNTQVHIQADVSTSTTDSSSNTSHNTTSTPVVRKVARKRSGSAILREPAALSHKKQRVAEPETTAATSISSQKDLDTDMDLLGNLQVHPPSQAFGGQFVSSPPTVPSQGTMVVYTGTGDGVTNTSEIRQTPSETHAREDSDKSLSVREVSAHTNTDLLQEQMAALRAEIARLNAENARFKSGELVTLKEKAGDPSFSSLKQELDADVL
ncbi:uncharacterized protein LOC135148452 [Daucus carota subsp. sativus]|uniref:uncharacterized protein LOC135148452 n=1 Tax=Daucus carota subsp. sativus TaxID=79200 RepID=UPI003083C3C0